MKKTIKSLFAENLPSKESAFRVAYFVSIFLSSITLLDIVSTVLAAGAMIWGFFLFKNRLKTKLESLKYAKVILLFLFFAVITAIINIKMDFPISFLAGLVIIYHAAICFFMFYGMYVGEDFSEIKKEMFFLFKLTVVLSTFFVTLSFLLLLLRDSFTVDLTFPILENYDHYERIIGIVKKTDSTRFTGVFINPNILAFVSVVSTIFCHILCRAKQFFCETKPKLKLCLVAFVVMLHFVALVLSDSIASFLFLVVYIVLWLFYKLVLENRVFSVKNMFKRSLIFLLSGLIIVLGFFSIRSYFQNGASNVIDDVYSVIANTTTRADIDEDIHFGRPNYELREGSGRRRLLEQAAFIFSKHPLFGIGSTNVVAYGDKYFETGIAFSNFHNGYVSILVCNGLVGFVLFMAFLVFVLRDLTRFLVKNCSSIKKDVFVNLLVCILSYLVFALFEKTLLSEINFMSVLFWSVLGYAVTYLKLECKR